MKDTILISRENLEESIKELSNMRIDLDRLYHQLKARATTYNGLEAANLVILAKAWLGEIMGLLGSVTPYKPVTEVKDIPNTQDSVKNYIKQTSQKRLSFLNEAREIISKILSKIAKFQFSNVDAAIYCNQTSIRIIEAKFHLGFELGILRDLNSDK